MAHNLTANITIENGTRIVAGRPNIDDDAAVMTIPLELRTAPATNYLLSRRVVTIRNGLCDRVVRVTPAVGSDIAEKLGFERNALTIETGFDRALAAWAGGGATADGKRNALVAELAESDFGVIDPTTLAGS